MEIIIDKNSADQRLDRFLKKYCKAYPDVKLGDIFARIRKGLVKVNAKKSKEDYRLNIDDVVIIKDEADLGGKNPDLLLSQKDRKMKEVDYEKIQDMIIFEDDNWIVFNKPYGIVAHPGNEHWNDLSMNDYLEAYTKDYQFSETFKPAFGYRLDKDTSGILIAAKTYDSLQYLNKIIRDREISKYYLAIVVGDFPKHMIIDKPIEKSFDKKFNRSQMVVNTKYGLESHTECFLEKSFTNPILGDLSLIKVKIITGRMHQIRIHTQSVGFPVLGDIVYGNPATNRMLFKTLKVSRHLLHCHEYSFFDMFDNKKVTFTAPMPSDFEKILNYK